MRFAFPCAVPVLKLPLQGTWLQVLLWEIKKGVIFLYCGLFLSFLPSCIMMLLMQKEADFIASFFLGEPRCAPLLIIISYAMPFAAVHSCICGYYIGLKKTRIPAISQLVEQIARVCSVFFLYRYFMERSLSAGISLAAVGLVMGEIFSSLFSLHAFRKEKRQTLLPASAVLPQKPGSWRNGMRGILQTSLPLTGNRVLLISSKAQKPFPSLQSSRSSDFLSVTP